MMEFHLEKLLQSHLAPLCSTWVCVKMYHVAYLFENIMQARPQFARYKGQNLPFQKKGQNTRGYSFNFTSG